MHVLWSNRTLVLQLCSDVCGISCQRYGRGHLGRPSHRLSSYTQMSSVAEPSIGSLIGSLEAEGQLEGRKEKEG